MALPETAHPEPSVTTDAEAYFAAAGNFVDHAIVGVDPQGRIVSWNLGAEKLFGHAPNEACGGPFSILVPSELAAEEARVFARVQQGETVTNREAVCVRQDGERVSVWLTYAPVRTRRGAVGGAVVIARDITEQKRLSAVTAQLRLAIDAAPNGIVMLDERGTILMANGQMERLFGYHRAEMIGQPIQLLIPERYRADAYFASPEVRAIGQSHDLFARRKDGTEFPVEVGLNPAHTSDGTFVLGAVIDISTRKKMEAEQATVHSDLQQHAQKLEATVAERTAHLQQTIAELEGVSYSLSHDLRGPLRTIQGFAQLVLEDAGDRLTAEERDLLTKAIKAAHRLDRLIQDVLTYTRVSRQSVTVETVDVERLLRQIIDERPELRRPHAEIEVVSPLFPVLGHEASLTQVITNLLDNAVKFMPPDRQPRVRVYSRRLDGYVEIWFQDNGIGIPAEAQGRLFAIFQRVHDDKKYPGTGIGLAIVRKAVERMGGHVFLESEVGVGTRFCVRLPKSPSP